jgi:peptidoglycan/xylan/chitin deacetylase (PgdA/CDA1 family)
MSHTKIKKPHHCKNHPAVLARGKCANCGAWICHECAIIKQGQVYCAKTCLQKTPAHKTTYVAMSARPGPQKPRARSLTIWAAFTLALCGLVFGLLQVRENRLLNGENKRLAQKRIDLLSYIEGSNRETDSLNALVDSLTQLRIAVPDPLRRRLHAVESPSAAIPVPGIPLSFDNGPRDQRLVALTFDGGSYANAAAEILDTLMSRNVKATMFLSGEFMRKHPDIVRRIAAEGHETGNHTFSHPHLTTYEQDHLQITLPGLGPEILARELSSTKAAYEKLTGKSLVPFWRAPYGESNRQICRWALEAKWMHVGWGQGRTWRQNLDSNDWIAEQESPGFHAPHEVLEKLLTLADQQPYGINGGIILMHLGTVRTNTDHQVHRILGQLIDGLRARGYRLITVSEMALTAGIAIDSLHP